MTDQRQEGKALSREGLAAKIEEAIHRAAELGDEAFDFIEGRGLHQMRLAIAARITELEQDARRLDLLERGSWDIRGLTYGDDDGDPREVYEIVGPINDREWEKRGGGKTTRDALDAALAHTPDVAAVSNPAEDTV